MKKEVKILDADHNPLKIGDKVLVDLQSKKRKPQPPVIIIDGQSGKGGGSGNKKTLRQLMEDGFTQLTTQMNTRFDSLEARVTKLETTLGNVITLNNLKS